MEMNKIQDPKQDQPDVQIDLFPAKINSKPFVTISHNIFLKNEDYLKIHHKYFIENVVMQFHPIVHTNLKINMEDYCKNYSLV